VTVETRFPVRYAETDQMGIVHHSVYPIWFECGRTDFIKHFGISYGELEKQGLLLPLIRMNCEFKTPAHYGENIVVKTKLLRGTKVRLILEYEVYAEERNVLCARGTTEHAWTGTDLKPVNIAKYSTHLYEDLKPLYNSAIGDNGRL